MRIGTKRALVGTALAGTLAGGGVVAQRNCGTSECEKLQAAVQAVCEAAPGSTACAQAQAQYEASCAIKPTAPPTSEPTTEPTVEPTVEPTTPPTPKPTVPPTPPPVAQAPLLDDEDLTLVASDTRKQTWGLTEAAINRWRVKNPEAWRGDGSCLRDGPSGIDTAFQGISDELLAVDVVAGQSISDSGQRSDCIFVNRKGTNEYEETHIFDYARGCAATSANAIKHMYVRGIASPEEPSVEGCSAPIPPKVEKWNLQFRNKWWDATPLFYTGCRADWFGNKVVGYCNAIGSDRTFCPARLDCEEGKDNFKCEERRGCEGVGFGGKASAVPLFRCQNGAPDVNPLQPFQARCAPGWIEVCATDGTNCTRTP